MYKIQTGKDNNQKNSKSLAENLFSALQIDILTGKFRLGEKLTEQHICDEYGVSRTPVREALHQLEMDGLIENIPNRGAFVLGFTEQDIEDMYELRCAYEVQAVRWATARITEDELDKLEETFEFMQFYTLKNDFEKMRSINTTFHELIYEAAHNRMLEQALSSYLLYMRHLRKTPADTKTYLDLVLEEHRAIFEAIRDGDADAGAAAMTAHMASSKARFER
ncbi:MAG: GntR family transcriptional regulator [Firmicutes bacterium]|nr:GntR family transcriptional regulator [Bacillota bacterium]